MWFVKCCVPIKYYVASNLNEISTAPVRYFRNIMALMVWLSLGHSFELLITR